MPLGASLTVDVENRALTMSLVPTKEDYSLRVLSRDSENRWEANGSLTSTNRPEIKLFFPIPNSTTAQRTMFSRALRTSRAAPLRRAALSPLVRRTVTTDAASAHADKDAVPEVIVT